MKMFNGVRRRSWPSVSSSSSDLTLRVDFGDHHPITLQGVERIAKHVLQRREVMAHEPDRLGEIIIPGGEKLAEELWIFANGCAEAGV